MRRPDIHKIRVLEENNRCNREEETFSQLITEMFPELIKNMHLQIQELCTNGINKKKPTGRHMK